MKWRSRGSSSAASASRRFPASSNGPRARRVPRRGPPLGRSAGGTPGRGRYVSCWDGGWDCGCWGLIRGRTMTLLLAVVVLGFVLSRGAGGRILAYQPPMVGVVAAGSPAEKSDIRPGDRITSVAGRSVDTWEQFFIAIESRANREVTIGLLRNGVELTRKVTPVPPPGNSRFEIGDIGVLPNVHPHIPSVVPGDPAERAGIKGGDVVVAVNEIGRASCRERV